MPKFFPPMLAVESDGAQTNAREKITMWLPTPIYNAVPYAFAGVGILAVIFLPSIGQISGALMLVTAYTIVRMRRRRAARRQRPSFSSFPL